MNTIPFFMFYSMFGFQRVGDLIWAAGDIRARGFLVGGTSGRTSLAGEGLQHCDGNSHALAYSIPNLRSYDPAFAYEVAVIVKEGMRRMFREQRDELYYFTILNETYPQPPMPDGVEEGILKGLYRFRGALKKGVKVKVHLLGSGAILNEVLKAQEILSDKYDVHSDVWSATSYKELYRDALNTERSNRLHPEQEQKTSYLEKTLRGAEGVFVSALDYLSVLPESVANWMPGPVYALGTDGFGRSDGRQHLRQFFEVDAANITLGALRGLADQGEFDKDKLKQAVKELGIDPDKENPMVDQS
jgi:pyruvate dehydrogenase E1 component